VSVHPGIQHGRIIVSYLSFFCHAGMKKPKISDLYIEKRMISKGLFRHQKNITADTACLLVRLSQLFFLPSRHVVRKKQTIFGNYRKKTNLSLKVVFFVVENAKSCIYSSSRFASARARSS
jgi:hypothetical protein